MVLKNFRRNYRLLNSIESLSVAYLLMIFSLIISNHQYLTCLDCGLGYKFQVSLMLIINFGSYQILTINAYLQKQRKQIKLFKIIFIPLLIYFPISNYLFMYSVSNFFKVLIDIVKNYYFI